MRRLIGNDLNWRSALTNMTNGTFPNIIILQGGCGSGKTEFAIDLARMLVCKNLNEDGYCGTCPECIASEVITDNTFMTSVSLINMTMLDQTDLLELVKENASILHHGNKVYIYDEFHAVPKGSQELWLSETRKLENVYLILTTTKLNQIDEGIRSRAIPMKMGYLSLQEAYQVLDMYDIPQLDPALMSTIYNKFRGAPRDIIEKARYCLNSGLTVEEQIEFLESNRKVPVDEVLLFIGNKYEYMVALRSMLTSYTQDEIISSTENYIWEYLIMSDEAFYSTDIGGLYTKEELIKLILDVTKQPSSAYLSLYARKRIANTQHDQVQIKNTLARQKKGGGSSVQSQGGVLEKW